MEEWVDGTEMPPDEGPTEQALRLQGQTSRKPRPPGYRRTILPAKYVLGNCTLGCSINPRNLPGELSKLVMEWYEEGRTNEEIHMLALRAANVKLSVGGLARHRKNHLDKVWQADERVFVEDGEPEPPKKKGHLDILEDIIQRGAETLPTGRITPELTIKAMEMHFKMTQGSAVDATIQAIQSAMQSLNSSDADNIPVQGVFDETKIEVEAPLEGDEIGDPTLGE